MQQIPHYVYIFNRYSSAEHAQAEVVIIRSLLPLDHEQLFERLERLAVGKVEEFRFLDLAPDVSVRLDTWDPYIENCRPVECINPVVFMQPTKTDRKSWAFVLCGNANDMMAGSEGIEPTSTP